MRIPCLVVVTYQFLGIKENVSCLHGVTKSLIPIQHTHLY
jgi:hypothetical protein